MSDDPGSRIVTGDADNTRVPHTTTNNEVNGTLSPLEIHPSDSNSGNGHLVNTEFGFDAMNENNNNAVPVQDPGGANMVNLSAAGNSDIAENQNINFRHPLAGTGSLSGGSALAGLSLVSNMHNIRRHPTVVTDNNQTSGATNLQNPLVGASFGPVQSTNLGFNPNPTVSRSQVCQRTFGGFQYQASTSQGGFGYRNPLVPEPSSSSSGGPNTLATEHIIPGIPTTELSILLRSNVRTSWIWTSASSSSPGLFGTTMMPPTFNQPGNLGQPQELHVVQASTNTSSHSSAGGIQVPAAVSRPPQLLQGSSNMLAAAAAASSSRGKKVALEHPEEADFRRSVRPRLVQNIQTVSSLSRFGQIDDAEAPIRPLQVKLPAAIRTPQVKLPQSRTRNVSSSPNSSRVQHRQGQGQPVVPVHAPSGSSALQADPRPVYHIKYRAKAELVGYNCMVCNKDVASPPRGADGRLIVNPWMLPVGAVLACGHAFHDFCLHQMTPPDQAGDPPCFICERQ